MNSVHLLYLSIFFALGIATVFVDGQDGDDHEPSLKPLCPPDETYYRECKPDCKNTCKNYDNPGVRCPCGGPGCFCREGLVLETNGKCVRPEQCKGKEICPKDEEYKECGTACPQTCNNYGAKIKCTAECKKGCFCKEGFIRRDDGKCVKPEECVEGPTCTGENEVYKGCVTPCPPLTCENYNKPPVLCIQICVDGLEGCYCKNGYVRNKEGKCVLPSQCPQENFCFGKNEVYKTCGTACPKTCDNYNDRIMCSLRCVEGCFCRDGYVRDTNGNCVLPSQCPPKGRLCLGKNEEFKRCKTECPRTCDNYDQNVACTKNCAPGCYCKKGYVRDVNGNCILPSQCPPRVQCKPNEEFSQCGGLCEPSCQTKPPVLCPAICAPGCVCKTGFIRIIDAVYGVKAPCIRKHMCPFFI